MHPTETAPESGDKRHFFDDPVRTRWFFRIFFTLCVIVIALDLFDLLGVGYHKETHVGAERVPLFYGLYGFVGIVVLVIVAKGLRKLVGRDEGYYDR